MRKLVEVDVSLEGKVKIDGKEVWKATHSGNPVNILYSRRADWLCQLFEYAPENANAFSKSKSIRKSDKYIRAVQYYMLHEVPQGPGFVD